MSSCTIHVIGFSADEIKGDKLQRSEVYAMNKMEMAQKKRIMEKEGKWIVGWYAQTQTGCKMIGADYPYEEISDERVSHINLIPCPFCNGEGVRRLSDTFIKSCFVCNGSGITKKGYWDKWQSWQLEKLRDDFSIMGEVHHDA